MSVSGEERSVQARGVGCADPEKDMSVQIPDGGWTAWLTVAGGFLIQAAGFGFVNAFGIFQDYYSRYFLTDFSSSAISWIGSTNSFLILSGGLFFGRIYDKGYFYWLVIGGCSLQVLCLFMLSIIKHNQFYHVFVCHGLGLGLATSISYVPTLAVLSHHFEKKRAIAMSIVSVGTPIGTAGYAILLDKLLNKYDLGFANSMRITAGINAALLLTGCALMRTRSHFPKTQTNYIQVLKRSFSDYSYIHATLGFFFVGAGSFFPVFYLQLDSVLHGLGDDFSFYTNVILHAGDIFGSVIAGFIASYCGISNAVVGSTMGCAIVTFAMIALSTQAGAVCIGIFMGFFLGVYVALCTPLIAILTCDLSQLGARMGIALFMAGVGSLIGTPLAGALLEPGHVWWKPAVLCGCFLTTGSFMFAATQLFLKQKGEVAVIDAPAD